MMVKIKKQMNLETPIYVSFHKSGRNLCFHAVIEMTTKRKK